MTTGLPLFATTVGRVRLPLRHASAVHVAGDVYAACSGPRLVVGFVERGPSQTDAHQPVVVDHSEYITSVAVEGRDRIWFSSAEGVFAVDVRGAVRRLVPSTSFVADARVLAPTGSGGVWCASVVGGKICVERLGRGAGEGKWLHGVSHAEGAQICVVAGSDSAYIGAESGAGWRSWHRVTEAGEVEHVEVPRHLAMYWISERRGRCVGMGGSNGEPILLSRRGTRWLPPDPPVPLLPDGWEDVLVPRHHRPGCGGCAVGERYCVMVYRGVIAAYDADLDRVSLLKSRVQLDDRESDVAITGTRVLSEASNSSLFLVELGGDEWDIVALRE